MRLPPPGVHSPGGFFWCAQHGLSLGGEQSRGCKSSTGPTREGGKGLPPPTKHRLGCRPAIRGLRLRHHATARPRAGYLQETALRRFASADAANGCWSTTARTAPGPPTISSCRPSYVTLPATSPTRCCVPCRPSIRPRGRVGGQGGLRAHQEPGQRVDRRRAASRGVCP